MKSLFMERHLVLEYKQHHGSATRHFSGIIATAVIEKHGGDSVFIGELFLRVKSQYDGKKRP
ncbi:MAG: hypothetical protein N2Z74_03065 [Syntrophales bacterium]|nr:hypothetical protein [Syntrophales bacterium]